MFTLAAGTFAESQIEVKKSRFLAHIAPVQSEAEAREVLASRRNLYPDARHHCSAFILDSEGATARVRFSDDGEPAGTGGPPILECLQGGELVNVIAVVTRYFGGTLLGTGGLVRAYSQATQRALSSATLVALETRAGFSVTCALAYAGKLEAEIRRANWQISSADWDAQVAFHFTVPLDEADFVDSMVGAVTGGQGTLTRGSDQRVTVPMS